ncbi:MAG TPA: site-2 protease family protein [Bryobacteraceae bacterium]|nr:site-2 protease family protein [Bryobacteraceae bacterium]
MKWSWKIGQISGIDLRIHATFLLLLGWVGASYWMAGKAADMLAGIILILALFACVVFHEMGHALAARKFGIATRDITLLPIGGLARLERMPEEPKQELWIALAGPAVNAAISVLLFVWLILEHHWEPLGRLRVATGPFVERLFVANVLLVLFNLIPAFPMDGGRVLRALLASRMTYAKATRIAAWVGQGIAFLFAIVGLFNNPVLLLIGVFVWIAARQEARAVQMKSALSGAPVGAAMLTDFDTLQSGDTLTHAVHLTLKGSQHDFPVTEQGKPIGILTRTDLLAALADHGPDHLVSFVMRREFPMAESDEKLEIALRRLQEGDWETMLIVHQGRLIGLATMDNVEEHILIDSILRSTREAA